MKLLITGGCGFLGSNLAAHALSQGVELCVFDSLYRHGSQSNLQWLRGQGNFDFVHGDIRNANDVQRVIARIKPDAIFHLAGQVAMTTSIADPRMDFEVNALGTLNVLEAVRAHASEAVVIYSSTNKVYGDLEQYAYRETDTRYVCVEQPEGFDEQTPLDFHSPYGCSKGSADQYLRDYHRIFGLKTVVFRHSSMYGGRQFATADQGWIGWFCQMAAETRAGLRRESFTISGNGKQVRDVLHAEDMISLYFSTLQNADAAAGQAFNIGGGITNSLSLLELFDLLEREIGQPLNYTKQPPRKSDQRVFVADIGKMNQLTGWTPKISAQEGVSRMLQWVSTAL
ncbi:GDP-mannose 4,6-dehydratase [Comamonas terrigena]|jgi:CDP-paratose 2-epimerase|uniref:GDP-mannose 4,6-dehydratase n=1 Tax=Comamonas terrigena TaxID=32013 RepID=UPI00244A864E|nr:GDP-mannose 4,6-dehydratase [Comamonas terrigena]MDH0049312.1 GDP-mannose 4,6-dehydratase [Comamonas terrigena]MDH0510976.1 GDP-mannose 4,6-dehydratase [Comamonas terrigena]MDH1090578.1 GDP-mannose 4,6-dehydratase [Comamonas terrigena]